MRTIICKNQSDAITVQKSLPDSRVIWPCVSHFRCFAAEVIKVMPDVDLDQDVEGMSLLQLKYIYPRIEVELEEIIPPMVREEWLGQRKFLNHRRNMIALLKNPRALMAAGYSGHEAIRIARMPVNKFLDMFDRRRSVPFEYASFSFAGGYKSEPRNKSGAGSNFR